MIKSPASTYPPFWEAILLQLAISPCPNDTFAFYGLLHGKTPFKPALQTRFADIEDLNRLCLEPTDIDFCKISFHAYLYLRDRFQLLNTGSALGFGCGPLLVAKQPLSAETLRQSNIAIPGHFTTATLLLKIWLGPALNLKVLRFDQIMPAVAAGEVDAGLIIHESRFTYPDLGLVCILDLGEWWERTTGCAIPLGGIVARRSLGKDLIESFDRGLGMSIEYAWAHEAEVTEFMRHHAQEMDLSVMRQHVALYVNDQTKSLGADGRAAVDALYQRAKQKGLLDAPPPH